MAASLGTLALGTYNNVANTVKVGTDPVLEVIASTDDADYAYDATNSNHTGSAWWDLADMPSDFISMATLAIKLRYVVASTPTNTWTLKAQVFASDGTTAYTDDVTVAANITTTTPTNSSAVAWTLQAAGTAASKTAWNAARVYIHWVIAKVTSGDTIQKRVLAAEVTGTYNQPVTHAATGVLAGPGSAVVGAAARRHVGTGVLAGAGAAVVGNAVRASKRAYLSWAQLTLPEPAAGAVTHEASGVLAGQGSGVIGSAARTRVHAADGVLEGAGGALVGDAARMRAHDATGVLEASGAAVEGAAHRTLVHDASGDLAGAGSEVAGDADRTGAPPAPVTHEASGVLTGAAAAIVGDAARTRVHDASGELAGAGSAIVADAHRTLEHVAEGVLEGPGSAVTGDADRAEHQAVEHVATGDLVGQGSAIVAEAVYNRIHDATGDLVGPGSEITGAGELPSGLVGGGGTRQPRRRKRYVLTVDGVDVVVGSVREAEEVLRVMAKQQIPAAKAKAERAFEAQRTVDVEVPEIRVAPEAFDAFAGLREAIDEAQERLNRIYADAMRTAEIAYLMRQDAERDDEEAMALLL